MKKCLYRSIQWFFSLFVGIAQNKETKLITGQGSMLKVIDLLKEKKLRKPLVVTTNGFIKRGTLDLLFTTLLSEGLEYAVFTDLTPDPTVESVEKGKDTYISNKCDSIIAIGGGSVLDAAKVIGGRVHNPKKPVRKMRGMLKVTKGIGPYFPIPATCGTGSEVTAAAVITDTINGVHYKYAVTDLKLIPDVAILDVNLLTTLPDFMLATTTMDALTHAIEAYVNNFCPKEIEKESIESVKLIYENFENAYVTRDIESLNNLLIASTKAGIAITHNFVGYVHALAHAIGAIYGLSHGYLNSIILPVILEEYGSFVEKKLKKINSGGLSYTLKMIKKMKALADLPDTIKELQEKDFDEIVRRAIKEANPTYPCPKILFKKDLRKVLNKLKGNNSK